MLMMMMMMIIVIIVMIVMIVIININDIIITSLISTVLPLMFLLTNIVEKDTKRYRQEEQYNSNIY